MNTYMRSLLAIVLVAALGISIFVGLGEALLFMGGSVIGCLLLLIAFGRKVFTKDE